MAEKKINSVEKSIKIDKSEKDIMKALKQLSEDKIAKTENIDARDHKITFDFEIYNSLLTKGTTILSK